jgi:hypothetical protein
MRLSPYPLALPIRDWTPIFYPLNNAGGMIGTAFAGPDKTIAGFELRAVQASDTQCGYWSPYGVAVSLRRHQVEGPEAIAAREMPALIEAAELMVKRRRRYGIAKGLRIGEELSRYLKKNPNKPTKGFSLLQYRPEEPTVYQEGGRVGRLEGTFKWGEFKGILRKMKAFDNLAFNMAVNAEPSQTLKDLIHDLGPEES